MIIISKKRIQILLSCILLGIFAFSFQIANQKESNKTQTEQALPTTSTPVSGKTIVVDAGHPRYFLTR